MQHFFFNPDWRVLAVRYALFTAAGFLIQYLLSDRIAPGLIPFLLVPYWPWDLPAVLVSVFRWLASSDTFGPGLLIGLGATCRICQLLVLAGLGRILWLKASGRDLAGDSDITLPVAGKRLWRPWFTTPLVMTGWTIVTVYILFGLIMVGHTGVPTFGAFVRNAGPGPFITGCVLGLLGMFAGYRFNRDVPAAMINGERIKYLSADHPLTKRVHAMAARVDLPPPKVAIIDVMNAFAMGSNRNDATVVIGVPLARILSQQELDAIIGHELAHIATSDMTRLQFAEGYQSFFASLAMLIGMWIGSVAGRFSGSGRAGTVMMEKIGEWFGRAGRWVLSLGGEILAMSVSRKREFHADALGAALTSPAAMIGALEKACGQTAHASEIESRYSYLMFRGFRQSGLFATHPSLAERRSALESRKFIRILPRRK